MEVAARLVVLVACAAAGGALLVLVATPARAPTRATSAAPAPLGGLAPAVLAAFLLLAGGTALTGAGTLPSAAGSSTVAIAGVGILGAAAVGTGRAARRLARAPRAQREAVASPILLVVAWAGAALALGSWLLALGAVAVALLASVRLERRAP